MTATPTHSQARANQHAYLRSIADIRASLAEYQAGKGMNAKNALRTLANKYKVVLKK